MTTRSSLIAAVAAIVTLFLIGPAAARVPKPTKYLQKEVEKVRDLLKETPAKDGTPEAKSLDDKLMAIVKPVMEFDKLSERALRKHWATLTEAQRKTFIELFEQLVFKSYLKQVRGANEEYSIAYEDEERAGDKAAVSAVAKTKKAEIELVFKLEARDEVRWVAADVVIDEVSIEENYREQFNKIIAKDGFDKLLEKMRKRLAEL